MDTNVDSEEDCSIQPTVGRITRMDIRDFEEANIGILNLVDGPIRVRQLGYGKGGDLYFNWGYLEDVLKDGKSF